MRINGTIYPEIKKLPENASPVSEWANTEGIQIGTVYMKYKRFRDGYITAAGNKCKGSDPGYVIRCYKGMNFVIPNNN